MQKPNSFVPLADDPAGVREWRDANPDVGGYYILRHVREALGLEASARPLHQRMPFTEAFEIWLGRGGRDAWARHEMATVLNNWAEHTELEATSYYLDASRRRGRPAPPSVPDGELIT